jgi:hypothetical protein
VVIQEGLDISVIENLILYSPTILYSQCVKTGIYVEFKKKNLKFYLFLNVIIPINHRPVSITPKLNKTMEKGLFKLTLRNT